MEANGQIHSLATSQPRKAFEQSRCGSQQWTEYFEGQKKFSCSGQQTPQDLNFYGQHFPLQHIQCEMQEEVLEAKRKSKFVL
jgi:hypothetical protein